MRRVAFCQDWEFSRDGGAFERVVVPHDAMLGNRRAPDAPGGSASGYYFGATYRYRKRFTITGDIAGRIFMLEFEGIYRDAAIRVNGRELPAPPNGFVPFFVDITDAVATGENLVEVDASNAGQPDCRWYSGAGIHRPVWLWEGPLAHIAPEGIRVSTRSIRPARIHVEIEASGGIPCVEIADGDGRAVARGTGRSLDFTIADAQLWSAEEPALYRCRVELSAGGHVVDTAEAAFGIRTVEWGPFGLRVNGRETLLRGGCIHCDNGILGAASFATSERRRIRLLKQAGFNAVRIAHNPAPEALLDACDEFGVYVMDEAWDQWFTPKSAHDYAGHFLDWCDFDLRRMVERDFNHPSVIMYSIGNEIADPLSEEGLELERSLVALLHSLDNTRPVTCGFNLTMMVMERAGRGWYTEGDGVAEAAKDDGKARASLMFNLAAQAMGTGMTWLSRAPGADKLVSGALDALDVAGYNYASARYAVDVRRHPGRVIVGSETFAHDIARSWRKVERHPAIIGDFMWAAWDYLGEAGAGAWAYAAEEAGFSKPWPWLIAGSGALDILGRPNAHAALAAAVWGAAAGPVIMVRPVNVMDGPTYKATWRGSDAIASWSWAGCEGTRTDVEVYDGRARRVRLELNGAVVATRRVRDCVARFSVRYEPGVMRAVALDGDGREIGSSQLASARGPLHIQLCPERACTAACEVAYVPVTVEDADGQVEANADVTLHASVEGGVLLAFGSARPATTESFLSGSYTTYRGCALAAVYRDAPGRARLTVRGAGFESVSTDLAFA